MCMSKSIVSPLCPAVTAVTGPGLLSADCHLKPLLCYIVHCSALQVPAMLFIKPLVSQSSTWHSKELLIRLVLLEKRKFNIRAL